MILDRVTFSIVDESSTIKFSDIDINKYFIGSFSNTNKERNHSLKIKINDDEVFDLGVGLKTPLLINCTNKNLKITEFSYVNISMKGEK